MYRGQYNFTLGLHARIQEFSSEGVQYSLIKKALTTFFFFLVLSLFYRSQMVYHLRFQRWSNIFRGGGGEVGGPTFPWGGGSNCLYPIETHITCDFPGGVRTPCPPLWIRTLAAFRLHGFIRVCISDSWLYKNCI